MYYVYILQSQKDKSYYTGSTTDLKARLKAHNDKKVTYSSTKAPFEIAWYCAFTNKLKAIAFERYLKEGSGFAFTRKHLL